MLNVPARSPLLVVFHETTVLVYKGSLVFRMDCVLMLFSHCLNRLETGLANSNLCTPRKITCVYIEYLNCPSYAMLMAHSHYIARPGRHWVPAGLPTSAKDHAFCILRTDIGRFLADLLAM